MKAYFELEQGSIEWHEIRYRKIGGSGAKGLFVDSATLLTSLIADFCEEFDEEADEGFVSQSMWRGKMLEPEAREQLKQYTGVNFIDCGWIQSDHELLGISPDGITEDLTIACEAKCFEKVQHIKTCLSGNIPPENIAQCVHYFTVNPKLETLYFISYRPENTIKSLFVKELKRDSMVSVGWKIKTTETRPNAKGKDYDYVVAKDDIRPISEWCEIAIYEADELKKLIKQKINNLKF